MKLSCIVVECTGLIEAGGGAVNGIRLYRPAKGAAARDVSVVRERRATLAEVLLSAQAEALDQRAVALDVDVSR